MLKINISYICIKCQSFLSSLKDYLQKGQGSSLKKCWFQIWRSYVTFPNSNRKVPYAIFQYWDIPNGVTSSNINYTSSPKNQNQNKAQLTSGFNPAKDSGLGIFIKSHNETWGGLVLSNHKIIQEPPKKTPMLILSLHSQILYLLLLNR